MLYPQGEPDNSDGQRFMSVDAEAVLTAYGSHNVLEEDLADLYAAESRGGTADRPKRVVTYRHFDEDGQWFVVSGQEAGVVFYDKTIERSGILARFHFEYPATEKERYDPVAAQISKSFRQRQPVYERAPSEEGKRPRAEETKAAPYLIEGLNRSIISAPAPAYPEKVNADIKFRITVNARGQVVSAIPVLKANVALERAAREVMLKRWQFNPLPGDAPTQTGFVTFRFRLE